MAGTREIVDRLSTILVMSSDVSLMRSFLVPSLMMAFIAVLSAIVYRRQQTFPLLVAKAEGAGSMERLIQIATQKFNKPFAISMNTGPMIMLPASYIEEIKNANQLSFAEFFGTIFFRNYPGFESFGNFVDGTIFSDVVRVKLTQALGGLTGDLSREVDGSLPFIFPQTKDWIDTNLYMDFLKLVTRLSSLVFVGREFDKLDDWHRVSTLYAFHATEAAKTLRQWPSIIRPIVHWFLFETRLVRQLKKEAQEIIGPEVERRLADRKRRLAEGKQPRKSLDTVDWFVECANGKPFDIAIGELTLAGVAIHTTTFTLVNTLLDICSHLEILEPMREEIRAVLKEDHGLKRQSIHKLKLMDSVLKESQRLHSLTNIGMARIATGRIELSKGVILPKGATVGIAPLPMYDPSIYADPSKFDGWRFLKKRQQEGQENRWQFTTTSPEHIAFGHGVHACPGRFFAGNELKIALSHLLLKYDWKLPDGEMRPGLVNPPNEFFRALGGPARLMYKSRDPDVDF